MINFNAAQTEKCVGNGEPETRNSSDWGGPGPESSENLEMKFLELAQGGDSETSSFAWYFGEKT